MANEHMFYSLLIIILAAFIVPFITSHIRFVRLPVVIGEIIAGLILGVSGFNLIETGPLLEFLSAFGFTYLMFLSGLEIDFQTLALALRSKKSAGANPVLLAFGTFGLTLIFSFLISMGLTELGYIRSPWLVTLVLSTTSLGIVVPVLKEKGIINTSFGQTILLSALIADFLTMLLITVVVLMLTSGQMKDILLVLFLFLAFFVFYKLVNILNRLPIIKKLADATSQIRIRGSFALILIFVVFSEYLGSEAILGAFLAGAIVSLVSEKREESFVLKLEAIGYGFFIPIFFIMVGATFNIAEAAKSGDFLILLPLLIIALYLVKIIPGALFRLAFSTKEALSAGFLLSSRLSLIIAAAAVGLKIGEISENTNGAIILSAIVTCLVSPLLFEKFAPQKEVSDKRVIIIGAADTSILLGERLTKSGESVTLIDIGAKQRAKAKIAGLNVLHADATTDEGFRTAGITPEDTIVITTNSDDVNLRICRTAVEDFGMKGVISVVNNSAHTREFKDLGVRVVSPAFSTLMVLENLVIHPAAFSLLTEGEDNLLVEEAVLANAAYVKKRLRDIRLPGDTLIMSVSRNGENIIPHGNTVLERGDLIMFVGSRDAVQKTMALIEH